jgi:hypothetical protein
MRILRPILIQVAIGVVLGIVLCTAFVAFLGGGNWEDALRQGWLLFLGGMGIGLVVWVLLLILFRRRLRTRAARVWFDVLAATIAVVVDLVVGMIVAVVVGGWDAFLVFFGFIAAMAFAPASLAANLLTNLLIAPDRATVPEPAAEPAAVSVPPAAP